MASFYEILGVKLNASVEQIRKAYYKKSLSCHPDKNDGEATEEFLRLHKAYTVLSDAEKRQVYDKHGEEGVQLHSQFDTAGAVGTPFKWFLAKFPIKTADVQNGAGGNSSSSHSGSLKCRRCYGMFDRICTASDTCPYNCCKCPDCAGGKARSETAKNAGTYKCRKCYGMYNRICVNSDVCPYKCCKCPNCV